jgi:hypothetical protein
MKPKILPPLSPNDFVLLTNVQKHNRAKTTSSLYAPAFTVNPKSVQEHTTGWKPVTAMSDPATYYVFSALKSVAIDRILTGVAPRAGTGSRITAAGGGMASDSVSTEFKVDGKSIEKRPWYGEVGVALVFPGFHYRMAYVKYEGSGLPERALIELVLSYRIVGPNGGKIVSLSENLVHPFMKMEEYLKTSMSDAFPTFSVDYRQRGTNAVKSPPLGSCPSHARLISLNDSAMMRFNMQIASKYTANAPISRLSIFDMSKIS